MLTVESCLWHPMPPYRYPGSAELRARLWSSLQAWTKFLALTAAVPVRIYQPAEMNPIWPAHAGHALGLGAEFRIDTDPLRLADRALLGDIPIDELIITAGSVVVVAPDLGQVPQLKFTDQRGDI